MPSRAIRLTQTRRFIPPPFDVNEEDAFCAPMDGVCKLNRLNRRLGERE